MLIGDDTHPIPISSQYGVHGTGVMHVGQDIEADAYKIYAPADIVIDPHSESLVRLNINAPIEHLSWLQTLLVERSIDPAHIFTPPACDTDEVNIIEALPESFLAHPRMNIGREHPYIEIIVANEGDTPMHIGSNQVIGTATVLDPEVVNAMHKLHCIRAREATHKLNTNNKVFKVDNPDRVRTRTCLGSPVEFRPNAIFTGDPLNPNTTSNSWDLSPRIKLLFQPS
jgi:hypothetical protein